jgi:uncharacterized membrane protein YbhN (UPF0104 family)
MTNETSPDAGSVSPSSPLEKGTWRGLFLRLAKAALAVGLLAWLVGSGRLDLSRIGQLRPSPWFAALAVLGLASMVLPIWRWWLLLRVQGFREPFAGVARLTWAGYFGALLLPGGAGGDFAKGYLILRRRGGARARALSTVMADRVLGLYSLLLLGISSVAWQAWRGQLPSEAAVVAAAVVVLGMTATAAALALLLPASRGLLFRILPATWRQSWDESFALYAKAPWALALCLGLSLASNVMVLATFSTAGAALGVEVPLGAAFLAGPLVIIASCLPISPGGVGVAETAADGLFGAFGVSGGAAVMLLLRLCSAVLALPGAAALFWPGSKPERSLASGARHPAARGAGLPPAEECLAGCKPAPRERTHPPLTDTRSA